MTLDEYAPRLDSAELVLEQLDSSARLTRHIIEGGFSWPDKTIEATFSEVRFEDCIFAGADLSGSTFEDCEFLQCSMRGADFRDARFLNCKLYCDDSPSDFRYAELRDVLFEGCDLTTCNFERASAYGLELKGCQAQGIDFTNVDFSMTLGRNQTVADFKCTSSNLAYADFSSTYLAGATFKSTRLVHAVMHDCDLSGATLTQCELDNLEATHLKLSGANLAGSRFNNLNPRLIDLNGTKVDAEQAMTLLTILGIEIL